MKEKVKSENPLLIFWRSLVSGPDEEKLNIKKQIEEIETNEDKEHISNLLHLVKGPSVKRARFNTDNIIAKVSTKKIRVTTERTQQEEKSLDEK